ncbi:MAG: site-specific DNA-methyltransferase [Verrucomicrobia bacterium]|nr:site-specific DNA-methyltransferase [Verrucomicrobiota bacterium]
MPTLNWIGKEAVVNHHHQVPFHLLKDVPELACGQPGDGNLIVQGDNLVALKALLPYYAGQVKCIYIDPPYNTGDESWVYNDNVNSPVISEWLGKTVGKEGEDLSRHDKWLCMLYPRLALLRLFLRRDGVIFVSMDETEAGYLRLLMDDIFGRENALGSLVWKRRSSSAMRGTPLSVDHEYVFCYACEVGQARLYGLEKGLESYPNEDERGRFASTDLTVGMGRDARPNQFYPITNPRTGRVYQPNPERVWRFYPETMQEVIAKGLIIWPDDFPERRMERPRYRTYFDPNTEKPKPVSSWIETPTAAANASSEAVEWDVTILSSGMNQEGGKVLQQILGTKSFAYPKPVSLVTSLVQAATRSGDLILDSFGGSGTTGHAVLNSNKADGGNRRFILVEMESKIARDITAERVKRVAQGYTNAKGEQVEGLGGGFRFCELGEPLFDERGQIKPSVRFADLARHVYFTETGEPLPDLVGDDVRSLSSNPSGKESLRLLTSFPTKNWSPLLGVCRGVGIYLLFNGILGDKSANGGNILTRSVLAQLPKFDGQKVIYCAGCLLGKDRLQAERIIVRQTPYEIKIS